VTNHSRIRISDTDAVYQAQGMVSVQAGCPLATALALMQNTAEATDETMEYIAEQVVTGQVRFDTPQ